MAKKKNAISPTREEDFPNWYQQVIAAADLAEHSPSRGSMIIKPWGYGVWEKIQKGLDEKIKELGHSNVYFPLMIPLSFLEKEAKHVEGFAKECAVVTHHRLKKDETGHLVPDGKLEEPLIVRPTSEMIIGEAFARWVESHRDLPLLINQWANVVRWEMRTRLFLRTTEFLWQEGHTAHATEKEAKEHALLMLDTYQEFIENRLAIPLVIGEKTQAEKFPGAQTTYTFEAMMQDGKALQAGTSHFLGQNFSKSCGIRFADETGNLTHAWTTSWGVTTRLIGAMIMVHSDDDGLVLPPFIAPYQAVILPIIHKQESKDTVLQYCTLLKDELESNSSYKIFIDTKEDRGKKWKWIKKGIPVRIEIGLKEIEEKKITFSQRAFMNQQQLSYPQFIERFPHLLQESHDYLFEKAHTFQQDHIKTVTDEKSFYQFFQKEKGFALCYYAEDEAVEEKIKNDLSATARCIFSDAKEGKCIFSGSPTKKKAIFAKAY